MDRIRGEGTRCEVNAVTSPPALLITLVSVRAGK
jgi:hypothetical protein